MVRSVWFDDSLRILEGPRPVPAQDEVVIRLRVGGICNTDLELMRGYKDFAGPLGHEFVGEVMDGPADWIGQRVVGEINASCGECDLCRRGMFTHCRRRRVLGLQNYDGAFAELFRLPARNLHRVPPSIPDEGAVFTEPLAAACQILEAVPILPSDRVVVIGAGKLGLLAAQVLRLTGAELSVIARRERAVALLEGWGIPVVGRRDLPENAIDVVVDCTGNEQGFAEVLALVRPRGTIVLKSTYPGVPQADLTRIAVNEIRVVGSRCGPFEAALRLLNRRLVEVEPLIEGRYALSEAAAAFEHAARPGALKVLLVPG
jgi:threonine dehydrogenase-like Zn-dependent dehydrogenase